MPRAVFPVRDKASGAVTWSWSYNKDAKGSGLATKKEACEAYVKAAISFDSRARQLCEGKGIEAQIRIVLGWPSDDVADEPEEGAAA